MNGIKELLNELTDAAIDGIFKNEKLINAVATYCWDINLKLVENGFSNSEAFELTKILILNGYLNSNSK